jgi:hypothetical protein
MKINVDEGYAFDYLSILHTKHIQNPSDENFKKWQDCYDFLNSQINDAYLWTKIIESEEIKFIDKANKKTFEAVERARYGEISAKEVDECNMQRYHAKIKFQNKFFPNSKIIEIKS